MTPPEDTPTAEDGDFAAVAAVMTRFAEAYVRACAAFVEAFNAAMRDDPPPDPKG